jgi:predicted dehydrogenase
VVFARAEFSYPGAVHPRTWLRDATIAGGGPIADVGVHCIDALRFILDDEVTGVSTAAESDADSGTVEASAMVSLQFRRSAIGAVMVSTRAQYRTPLEFVGQSGVLRANDGLSVDQPVTIERRRGEEIENEQVSNHLAYARQVDAFAAAVEGRAAFPAPGEEGWRNQVILDAAYKSMRTGCAEAIESGDLAFG